MNLEPARGQEYLVCVIASSEGEYSILFNYLLSGPVVLRLSLRNAREMNGRSGGGTWLLHSSIHFHQSSPSVLFCFCFMEFCVNGLCGRNSLRRGPSDECGIVLLQAKISCTKKHSSAFPIPLSRQLSHPLKNQFSK